MPVDFEHFGDDQPLDGLADRGCDTADAIVAELRTVADVEGTLDADAAPRVVEFTAGEADETAVAAATDFLDSLWRVRRALTGGENGDVDPLVLLGTTRLAVADWERVASFVGDDGDDSDDGGSAGTGTLASAISHIKRHLQSLTSLVTTLLSTAGSLDSWTLSGDLSGSVPGFAGSLGLSMTFD
ncbi:MAG: hypothetical protein ABEJ68_11370 [Halobacteriaceae archaeon]